MFKRPAEWISGLSEYRCLTFLMLVYKIGFLDYQMITSDQIFSVPVCIDLWADWIPELSKNLFLPEPFRARKCQLDKLSFVFTFFCSLGAAKSF